jgi:hypothetical protein
LVVEQCNPKTRRNDPVPVKGDPSRTLQQLLDNHRARLAHLRAFAGIVAG